VEQIPENEKKFLNSANSKDLDDFAGVPFEKRILFLSHCILKEQKEEIKIFAENLGYKVHVVGGGSIVHKLIKRENPEAVVGVACYPELEMAVEKIAGKNLPFQIIRLDTDGCKDTIVNVENVKRILAIHHPQSPPQ